MWSGKENVILTMRPFGQMGNLIPDPWGKRTKYKCLAPAQNRLPNALVEEMEGELNKFWIRKTNYTFNYFLF